MEGYKRSAKSKSYLKVVKGVLYTTKDCEIHVLSSFEDRGLILQGDTVEVVGSLAIVFPDSKTYVVMNSMAMYKIDPELVRTEEIKGQSYHIFSFEANTPLILSSTILLEGDLPYVLLDSYYFLGRIPWFMSYSKGDVTQLFMTAGKHSGVGIDKLPAILSLLSAAQARLASDSSEFARHHDVKDKDIRYVGLKYHIEGVTHNFNKITTAYQSEGLMSAIVKNKIGNATTVEEIVRA